MDDHSPLVKVEAVTKRFVNVTAVDQLSFTLRPGEIFALLGPNGAGKTTMVRMLVNVLRPDSGRIVFSDELSPKADKSTRLPAGLLGYLPEERGLYPDVPLLRTLEHFGVLHGMDRSDARSSAAKELRRFALAGREDDRVDALSKGNQQKVQFVAAVMHRPRFAVLDEPFSGLDPVNQERFIEEIRRLRDDGCTILLSAHQMDLVESVADRLLLMDRGRAVLWGSLEEIRQATRSGDRIQLGISPQTATQDFEKIPGVAKVERPFPDQLRLELGPEVALGSVLRSVAATAEISSIHSAAESLREIFVRTVGHPIESDSAEDGSA